MTPSGGEGPRVRIGELARRAGLPPATLRAWERRYGIVRPQRAESGYRLYSGSDERRLRQMLELITRGVAPAEAAQRVLSAEAEVGAPGAVPDRGGSRTDPGSIRPALTQCLLALDEPGCHTLIDGAIGALSIRALLREVLLPVLRDIGERWAQGTASVAQEHFASAVIRGRLLPLARGWGAGSGPVALLACPPGEAHDLGLLSFGLLVRESGWRVLFFGADTPLGALEAVAKRQAPDAIVLALVAGEPPPVDERLTALGAQAPLLIGGPRAGLAFAGRIGAELLPADVFAAADRLVERAPGQ